MNLRSPLLLSSLVLALAGCGSAERSLVAASSAIERCDVREAHGHLADAWHADRTNPDAALGFALTELLFLAETEEGATVLRELGFTEKIDVQNLLFSSDGLLSRLRRKDSCSAVNELLRSGLKHPSLQSNASGPFLLPPALKGEQLREPLARLSMKLAEIADAFDAAATQRKEGTYAEFSINDCGSGAPKETVVLLKPELLGLAAFARSAHAAIEVTLAYDWDLTLNAQLNRRETDLSLVVDELNNHFGRLKDRSRLPVGHAALKRAADEAIEALTAARDEPGHVGNSLLEWSAIPDARFDELLRMVKALRASLDRATVLPDITPGLTVDLNLLLTSPPDLSQLSRPAFSIGTGMVNEKSYSYLATDEAQLTPLISGVTSPDLATYRGPSMQWAPSKAFNEIDFEPVVYPSKRYEGRYGCR